MQVTIIGSGTAVPSLHRASPCIMLEAGGHKLLLDTGPGTLRQLVKAGAALNDIDLIIYSHFHIDHTADMIPYIFACKYTPGSLRTRDLTIIGPVGIKNVYRNLTMAYGTWVVPEHFAIEWIEAAEGILYFKNLRIHTALVKHMEGSIAVRVEDSTGKSVVYSGDTEYCEGIVAAARNADLLILECAFPEGMPCTGHLVPSLAGRIARESHCRRLLLTHFYPPCDSSDLLTPLRERYSGEVVLAEDLLQLSI